MIVAPASILLPEIRLGIVGANVIGERNKTRGILAVQPGCRVLQGLEMRLGIQRLLKGPRQTNRAN